MMPRLYADICRERQTLQRYAAAYAVIIYFAATPPSLCRFVADWRERAAPLYYGRDVDALIHAARR